MQNYITRIKEPGSNRFVTIKSDEEPRSISQQVRTINRQKSVNITNVVKSVIPTTISANCGGTILYAQTLINFVKSIDNNSLDKLLFDTTVNDLNDLITALQTIVFEKNYYIRFDEDSNDANTQFLKPFYDFAQHYYIIDLTLINATKNKALKIGLAKLYIQISKGFYFGLDTSAKGLEDVWIDYGITEWLVEDEEITFDYQLEEEQYLTLANKTLNHIFKYAQLDINLFLDYKPKSKANKELKAIIEKGFNIDWHCINHFTNQENDEESLDFLNSFDMCFGQNNAILKEHQKHIMSRGNQVGVDHPNSYVSFCNGVLTSRTTEHDFKELNLMSEVLIQLNTLNNSINSNA